MYGIDVANRTIPAEYKTSPVPVRFEVTVSDTLIPGPKGEMAAGPRKIGFSAGPVTLAVLATVIFPGAAGVWYLVRRKPAEADRTTRERNKPPKQ
jgi:hypothetical protein